MRKARRLKRAPFLLVLVADALLLVAVVFWMRHVQSLLNLDVQINLTEIVTQNKDVITSKLMLEINNLDLVSQQLADRFAQEGDLTEESARAVFWEYAQTKDESLCWADEHGHALYGNGQEVDISGRQYFRFAMEGRRNISERLVSRLTGDDIFVISVPLILNDETIGTVQKQYTPQQMYELCSVSLFSEQGYTYIINSQGYILISSEHAQYNRESDNYFRILYLTDPEGSDRLKSDIQNDRSGFMETQIDGKTAFSAYTPLNQVYDWYLITSVDTSAVSPNASLVIQLFYIILLSVVLFFGFILVYYFVSKNRQQAQLEQVAFVDTVTKGGSYAKFLYELQNLLPSYTGPPLAILLVDVDNFRYINSRYGFDTGDAILQGIYAEYDAKLLPGERLGRVSGDHFAALLVDFSPERLAQLFYPELCIDGVDVYLTAGLYPITNLTESINLMVDKATLAARKGKELHHKQVHTYSEELDRQLAATEQTKRAMELALANGEIVPFFQPKVDIRTGRLVGAEALARWRKADGSYVSPADFIPMCEKTGLILSLDMAVFERTLAFLQKNLQAGVECIPISVNFSRMHLFNKDFSTELQQKLLHYQVPPELIEVELTETAIFDNYQRMGEFIRDLHQKGLQISMDDFGSGYSSLHMLKDVEIDVLKIDQGFLRDTVNSERQRIIFDTIVQMARRLEIKIVVEGVETAQNVELMEQAGCHIAQGFYYARPMDCESFEVVYKKGVVE